MNYANNIFLNVLREMFEENSWLGAHLVLSAVRKMDKHKVQKDSNFLTIIRANNTIYMLLA